MIISIKTYHLLNKETLTITLNFKLFLKKIIRRNFYAKIPMMTKKSDSHLTMQPVPAMKMTSKTAPAASAAEDECIYDQDGFKMRAAAVCIRDDSESEVLLVSSFTRPDSWIVPAGKVQMGEESGACALREAEEEGGARGRLGRYLGSYEHQDRNVKKRTAVFVLYVDQLMEDFQERDRRKRQWFPIQEAFNLLALYKPQQGEYLMALQNTAANNKGCRLFSRLGGNQVQQPSAATTTGNGCGAGSDNNSAASYNNKKKAISAPPASAAATPATSGKCGHGLPPFIQDSLVSKETIKKNDVT